MIGLEIPWIGTAREGQILAAIRAGTDPGKIERDHKIKPSDQIELYSRYIRRCVENLSDHLEARELRAAIRDHVLHLMSQFYPLAAQGPNLKAAQMFLAAVRLYASLDREHYELDRQQMLDQGQESADYRKPLTPEEASRRRQDELREMAVADGLPVPESAKLAGSMILGYQKKG